MRRALSHGVALGGVAAIRVVRDIPDSIALVWNSQTDIAKYERGHVSRYLRIAFPTIAAAGSLPSDGEQFPSLCADEFCDGYKGNILYLQEKTDWHVGVHLDPFLASFCKKALSDITDSLIFSGFVTDRLYLHLDHWGNGHVPPSKDVISMLLKLLSDFTSNLDGLEIVKGFPTKAIEYIASTLSQHESAQKI